MRLTRYTDYALRVLTYLAARPGELSSISEMARGYDISHNHLMKVVHHLRKLGYVESARGRAGGVRLARDPAQINVGQVVRATEDGFNVVDCSACRLLPACSLKGLLSRATQAFLAVLEEASLADLVKNPSELRLLLGIYAGEVPPLDR